MSCDIIISNFVVNTVHADGLALLTHWGLVKPYGDEDPGSIGSGNGLLPDSIKSLPEAMV